MYCHNCGSPVKEEQRFCGKCGAALEEAAHDVPRHDVEDGAGDDRNDVQLDGRAPSSPKDEKRMGLIMGCAAAIIAVIVWVVITMPKGGESSDARIGKTNQGTSSIAGASEQNTVEPLERPSLLKQAVQSVQNPVTANVEKYAIATDLSNVTNTDDVLYPQAPGTPRLKSAIEQNGFAIDATYGTDEFFDIYESNRYGLIPSFVTVDSMMHTYHLYFQHLQKNTERKYLANTILGMSQQLLANSLEQLEVLRGTDWENAALRNVAFFAVGVSLQDSTIVVPQEVAQTVANELVNIQQAEGLKTSAITGEREDYSQYKVRGYYEGDPLLESYFRTMMWYGRINFVQKDEDMDRSALLMTLALRDDALKRWEAVYAVTSFFAGASDDSGYCEYQPMFEAAYGKDATVNDLPGNTEAWTSFHQLTASMPAPQINSVPLGNGDDPVQSRTEAEKGFRLMGQRFSIDEMIFTQLLYPEIGANSSGANRYMPDAIDVPSALGSDVAFQIARDRGYTDYSGYEEKISTLRSMLKDEIASHWSASLYSQWLYTLNPLLAQKGEGYPTFMQSNAWSRKDLQTYLGSYTELKHDTVLYSKQVMAEGGGMMEDRDDRGYVEPEPEVFERLANLTDATSEGLSGYSLLDTEDSENLDLLIQLARQLSTIARKELSGEAVSLEDYELIRGYGVQLEHFWKEVYKNEMNGKYFSSMQFPAAIVCDIATNADAGTVLEVGTGKAVPIYVVVPVDGSLRVAKGAAYSFYQFEQPLAQHLTDSEWREMLSYNSLRNSNGQGLPSLEDWTNDFTVIQR